MDKDLQNYYLARIEALEYKIDTQKEREKDLLDLIIRIGKYINDNDKDKKFASFVEVLTNYKTPKQ